MVGPGVVMAPVGAAGAVDDRDPVVRVEMPLWAARSGRGPRGPGRGDRGGEGGGNSLFLAMKLVAVVVVVKVLLRLWFLITEFFLRI